MKRYYYTIFYISLLFLTACNMHEQKNIKLAQEFYQVYGERKDLDKLMDFYATSSELDDAVPQSQTIGKEEIKKLYSISWTDTLYKAHPDYPSSVTIKNILSNDSIIVISGQYNPFSYNGKSENAKLFTTWLYLDKNNKITKQVEWTQFPFNELQEIINFKNSTINTEL